MNPAKWKAILEPLGFTVLYHGYFKEFDYWLDAAPKGYFRNKIWNMLRRMEGRMRLWKPNNSTYSPCCGLIAKKK
jgi:hypothetical protein